MKFATTTALATAIAIGFAGTVAGPALAKKKEEAAAPGPKFSPEFRKVAPAFQAQVNAGDVAGAQAALPAVQAAATTPDDKYNLGILVFQLGQKAQNDQLQMQGADMAAQSGVAPPNVLSQLANFRGVTAYNKGDMAAADAAFSAQYAANPNDFENAQLLAQVKVRQKQPQAALQIMDKAIDAQTAAGQPVSQDVIRRALSIAYDAKFVPQVAKYGLLLVKSYPSAETWRIALQTYRESANLSATNQQADLDTLRLMASAGALAGERDYFEYANLANDKGFPGEAKAVIDAGQTSNMVDAAAIRNSKVLKEINALAAPKIAADKAALPGLEKSARAAADGKRALNTADAYLGYGLYPQAIELYKVALQKGGVDAGTVNLRMGEALAKSGQKAAADQTFGAITGPLQPLAQFWMAWTDQGAKKAAGDPNGTRPAAAPAGAPKN